MAGMIDMDIVAKLLGVEVDEDFKIVYECGSISDDVYSICSDGLFSKDSSFKGHVELGKLLHGIYKIKKLPWTPRDGEWTYMPDISGTDDVYAKAEMYMWNSEIDVEYCRNALRNKLPCRTKEEAFEKANKILELWNEYCESGGKNE
jgi:hypothetical protein